MFPNQNNKPTVLLAIILSMQTDPDIVHLGFKLKGYLNSCNDHIFFCHLPPDTKITLLPLIPVFQTLRLF